MVSELKRCTSQKNTLMYWYKVLGLSIHQVDLMNIEYRNSIVNEISISPIYNDVRIRSDIPDKLLVGWHYIFKITTNGKDETIQCKRFLNLEDEYNSHL